MGAPTPGPARSLKARAIQWLAQREHSRVELRRKLMPHALAEAAAAEDPAAGLAKPSAMTLPGPPPDLELDPRVHRPNADAPVAGRAQARVDALLDWLEANAYLSQQRFVESRVHARASRFGNVRIRQELSQHHAALTPDLEFVLKDGELARARALWAARFTGRPSTAPERSRQARFLAGRGFSGETIHRLLRELGKSPDADSTMGDPGD